MIKKIINDGGNSERETPSKETETRISSNNYINIYESSYLKVGDKYEY